MKGQRQTLVVDGYTRFCLTAIVVLLTVLIVGLWADGPDLADRAQAKDDKVPMVKMSALAQRAKLIAAAEQTNQKLDKLVNLLASGKLEVVVSNLEGGDVGSKTKKR